MFRSLSSNILDRTIETRLAVSAGQGVRLAGSTVGHLRMAFRSKSGFYQWPFNIGRGRLSSFGSQSARSVSLFFFFFILSISCAMLYYD